MLAVNEARSEADLRDVQALCNSFLGWLRERYANELWVIEGYYAPAQWREVLDSLSVGGGPRICIGKSFAMLEAIVIFSIVGRKQFGAATEWFKFHFFDKPTPRPLSVANSGLNWNGIRRFLMYQSGDQTSLWTLERNRCDF